MPSPFDLFLFKCHRNTGNVPILFCIRLPAHFQKFLWIFPQIPMKFLIAIHSIHLVQKRYRLSVYNRAAICPVNAPFPGHGSNASFDRCEIAAFRLLERIIRYCNIVSISDVIPDGKCEACLAFLVHQLLGRADWLPCSILCQAPRLEGCLLDWLSPLKIVEFSVPIQNMQYIFRLRFEFFWR